MAVPRIRFSSSDNAGKLIKKINNMCSDTLYLNDRILKSNRDSRGRGDPKL